MPRMVGAIIALLTLACYTGHQNKFGHLGRFDIIRQTWDWFICQQVDIWHILLLQICKAPCWLCSIKTIKHSCVTWSLGHQKFRKIKLNHIPKYKVSISKRDFFSCWNNQCCCHMNIIEYRNHWYLIYVVNVIWYELQTKITVFIAFSCETYMPKIT